MKTIFGPMRCKRAENGQKIIAVQTPGRFRAFCVNCGNLLFSPIFQFIENIILTRLDEYIITLPQV